MNLSVPPGRSNRKAKDRTVNRLLDGELLDLYVAVLIVLPIVILLRFV